MPSASQMPLNKSKEFHPTVFQKITPGPPVSLLPAKGLQHLVCVSTHCHLSCAGEIRLVNKRLTFFSIRAEHSRPLQDKEGSASGTKE